MRFLSAGFRLLLTVISNLLKTITKTEQASFMIMKINSVDIGCQNFLQGEKQKAAPGLPSPPSVKKP
jgi:hypothetical protein